MWPWSQPGFSRDFPIYYFLISYIYFINRYLLGQFSRSFKEAQVRPILKKSTLDPQLPSSYRPISNFSVLSKLLKRLVLSHLLTHLNKMHYFPRHSQHIVRTTPRKLMSWEMCLTSGWHWMLVTSPFFCFLTCLRRLTLWTMTSSLPDWIKHLQFAKRLCSDLGHTFQEVKQYYLRPHAKLNSSFDQAFHWDSTLCTGTNSLLPVCFRHCGYCCRPWSLQLSVCRWHPDLRPLQP